MDKYTPGPWTFHHSQRTSPDTWSHIITAQAADDGRTVKVAEVFPISDDGQVGGESYNNAHLITASREMFTAIDEADTAFAVLNLCDDLTPQAKSALRSAWAKVQAVLVALSPDGALAEAVKETPDSALNVQKYLDSKGTICPFCGEEDIEGGPVETGNGKANQEMSCAACDKKWLDLYELVNIMTYEEG